MLGKAIYSKLSGTVAVSADVGTRIFPEAAPEQGLTFPLIVYSMTDAQHINSYSGASSLANRRVTVQCAASTYSAANTLAKNVRETLDNQSGTWGGIVVQGAFIESQQDAVQTVVAGEDLKVYVAELEFLVWFQP
jgi:hypothetical protein